MGEEVSWTWPRKRALEELSELTPRIKANRLAVDRERTAGEHNLSWPEMVRIAHSLDDTPELVEQFAREYDQLVREGSYEKLYGEYWPGKELPPILKIWATEAGSNDLQP